MGRLVAQVMPTIKTAVSLPADVFAALDEAATEERTSRSAVITAAVREYLLRRASAALTRQFDKVYRDEQLADEDRAWLEFALAAQTKRLAEEGDSWPAE